MTKWQNDSPITDGMEWQSGNSQNDSPVTKGLTV